MSLRPDLAEALLALRRAGCLAALVSGSGPSIFGLAPSQQEAEKIARSVPSELPPTLRSKLKFVPLLSGLAPQAAPEAPHLGGSGQG